MPLAKVIYKYKNEKYSTKFYVKKKGKERVERKFRIWRQHCHFKGASLEEIYFGNNLTKGRWVEL